MTGADAIGAMTVAGEAANEPYLCKVGVAATIRARARIGSPFLSDGTIIGTVLAPLQFDCWRTGSPTLKWMDAMDVSGETFQECLKAWQDSLTSDPTNGADSYYATTIAAPSWATPARFKIQLGQTRFYAQL